MSEPVQLAKAAREKLAAALNALQSDDDVPNALLEAAEPIAQAMSVLHRVERTNGQNLEGRDSALAAVRSALDQLQKIDGDHPAVDAVMEAVAGSLSKVHALARYQPPAAAPAPQPAAAPAPQPVAQPAPQPVAQPVIQPTPILQPAPAAQPAPQPQPQYAQPAPQPQYQPAPVAQPAPQPQYAQPAPQPQYAQPAPQPQYQAAPVAQPAPQPQYAQPAPQPQPQYAQPAPQPQYAAQPAPQPQPQYAQPAPQPQYAQPERQPQQAFQPVAATVPIARPAQPAAPAPQAAPALAPQAAPAPATRVPPVKGAIDVELGIHSASNFYKGLSGNDVIEHGGIFVATYKVPKIGTTVNLRVLLPGDYEFQATGVVQWTREGGSADPGFGARFTQISPEGKQLVYRYARNREPMFYDDL
ncbi:Cell division protein FtsK [Minicystis rosea]|nr:Cell division protein FtsK [Minicystis rosea]